jgi:hypothetical protein
MRTATFVIKTAILIALMLMVAPADLAWAKHISAVPACSSGQQCRRSSLVSASLSFEKSVGQAATRAKFLAKSRQYRFLLTETELGIIRDGALIGQVSAVGVVHWWQHAQSAIKLSTAFPRACSLGLSGGLASSS